MVPITGWYRFGAILPENQREDAMIDWARVNELRDEVGEEDFAEIAGLFMAELSETIDDLALMTDPAALRDGYHGLKGSALNLGFSELATLCAAAERDPTGTDLKAIRAACGTGIGSLCEKFPELAA